MSSIGQVGSSFLSGSSSLQSASGAPRGRPPEPTAEMKAQFEAKFESAAEELGLDASSFKELRSKIDEAVKNAKSNAADGKASKSAIDEAIDGVLKENGVDPAEFKSQMKAVFEKMGMPKPGEGGFPPGGPRDQSGSIKSLMDGMPAGAFVDATA